MSVFGKFASKTKPFDPNFKKYISFGSIKYFSKSKHESSRDNKPENREMVKRIL